MALIPVVRSFLRPSGMKNKGNTCFFNATLQCLLSIPGFISFLKAAKFSKSSQPISHALQEFVYDYQNHNPVDPSGLIRAMRSKIRIFNGQQQDAHCFLLPFLDLLIEEQGPGETELRKMFRVTEEDTIRCRKCDYVNTMRVDTPEIHLFIKGSVTDSLNHYLFMPDEIKSGSPWKCEKCAGTNEISITHRLASAGDYLIFCLGRFTNLGRKNTASIYVDEEVVVNGRAYENVAVVCHLGQRDSGHYYAKGRRDKGWYMFNDASADKTDRSFEGNAPYLLFYALKK